MHSKNNGGHRVTQKRQATTVLGLVCIQLQPPLAFHLIVSCLSHFSICPNVSSLDIGPSGSMGREVMAHEE